MPSWFWGVLRLASALLMTAGLLLVLVACLYAICYAIAFTAGFIPLIGKRHRHARWTEMNRAGETMPRPEHDKSNY